jgi:hypothetical protein
MIPTPEQTTKAVSDAITSALAHVAACAAARLTDEGGHGLAVASRTARALGASHAQVVTAMRGSDDR